MKCQSCDAVNPPEFVWSIKNNICAGCGSALFSAAAKELLDELIMAMEKMPKNPQGVAGWLLSNYEFRKIGDAKPVEKFHQKIEKNSKESQEQQLKIAPNKLQQFLKSAGVKDERRQQLAQLAKEIKENSDPGADYGEVKEEQQQSEELEEAKFPEFTKSVLSAMSPGKKTNMKPADKADLLQSINEEDFSKHPALQEQRMERLRKQNELQAGGKIGKISRSE